MAKWIKWNGGACPVATGTKVDLKHRDGLHTSYTADETDNWPHHNIGDDIVSYRIHTTTENPITHKALAKLHAKLDLIERNQSRILTFIDAVIVAINTEDNA